MIKNYNTTWIAELTRPEAYTVDWTVEDDGTMIYNGRGRYVIEGYRLADENWLDHMSQKSWVDMNTFVPAYLRACENAGVTTVKVTY